MPVSVETMTRNQAWIWAKTLTLNEIGKEQENKDKTLEHDESRNFLK